MQATWHGSPVWYELATNDLPAARRFYAAVLGWSVVDSGMPGMEYLLAKEGETNVAGIYGADQASAWTLYFAVTDCDAAVAQALATGATVLVPPGDVPGTGRFAVLADPQGAPFGLLQPIPMEDGSIGGAFDQNRDGHGNWHELVCPDPKAGLKYYMDLFGWTLEQSMPMGPDFIYHIFACNGVQIGGAFAPDNPAAPYWKPYFGTASTSAMVKTVTEAGGTVLHGHDEVPGGTFTLQCRDPQGAIFALVGPH